MVQMFKRNIQRLITLDDIYAALLAKEREHAIGLYAELEGVNEQSARVKVDMLYRVFYIGYTDCLNNIALENMPKFNNDAASSAWKAGFNCALKLPTMNVALVS
jgi:hypothetical protein